MIMLNVGTFLVYTAILGSICFIAGCVLGSKEKRKKK